MKEKLLNFNENLPKLTKQQAIAVIVISMLIGLAFVFFIFSSRYSSTSDSIKPLETGNNNAYVFILKGGPRLKRNNTSRTVQDGEVLNTGDTILNDAISRSIIVFSDNTYIIVDTNSSLVFSALQMNNKTQSRFVQKVGRTYIDIIDSGLYDLNFNLRTTLLNLHTKSSRLEIIVDAMKRVKVSTINGQIDIFTIDSVNNELNKATLNTGKQILVTTSNEDLKAKIQGITVDPTDNWFKLYKCTDKVISKLLQGGNNKKYNFLRNQAHMLVDCRTTIKNNKYADIETKRIKDSKIAYEKSIQKLSQQSPEITSVSGSFSGTSLSCDLVAKGKDITGYRFSIGTSAGTTDISDWQDVSTASLSTDIPSASYSSEYYCNGQAIGKYGDSKIVSSGQIVFDNSMASIDSSSITFPPGTIGGDATYTNMPDSSDLKVGFYIKDVNGKFLNAAGVWVDNQVLLTASIADGSSTFSFLSDSIVDPGTGFSGGVIYVTVTNTATGRILDQTLVTIP